MPLAYDVPFRAVHALTYRKAVRQCINAGFALAVELEKKEIAYDIIEYSNQNAFTIEINDRVMQMLIKCGMFGVIDDLITANAKIIIEYATIEEATKAGGMQKVLKTLKSATKNQEGKWSDTRLKGGDISSDNQEMLPI